MATPKTPKPSAPADAALPPAVDVLAFGPHPDDVDLCASGLLLKAKASGQRCVVVDLTRGERASRGDLASRQKETDKATALLGLVARENLGLPDCGLESTAALTEPVVAAIRRWRPRLVVGPCPVDLHPDHEAAAAIVRRAYYLSTIAKADGGGLPPHRPDALVHYYGHKEPEPTFVVDVSDVWEARRAVVMCWASQLGTDGAKGPATNLTAPDFLRRYETRFAYWGGRIGAAYGEPYFAERVVPLDDPVLAFRKRDGAVR
jgi:bacillithiol biosynthesis deacetylase BshB1